MSPFPSSLRKVDRTKRDSVWSGMLRIPLFKNTYLIISKVPLRIGELANEFSDSPIGTSQRTGIAV